MTTMKKLTALLAVLSIVFAPLSAQAASGVKSWSTTAATNSSADSTINWAEGQAPSTVNDSARAMMAAIAAWFAQIDGGTVSNCTVGGSASAITLTCSPTVTARAAGQRYAFALGSTLTGATTLAVDGLTSGALQWRAAALAANDFVSGEWIEVIDDGTSYQLVESPRLSAGAAEWTTDSTGGATGDFIPFVDVSDSNFVNKVLTTDLFKNVLANFTAKAAPVPADSLMIADSAASGAAKISTITQFFASINGLTADATPDATADYVVTYDASATTAKKVLLNLATPAVSQANQETATSNVTFVTPGRQQFHPSAVKAWAVFVPRGTNGAATVNASYNVSGVQHTATGVYEVSFSTAMSSTAYACTATTQLSSPTNLLNLISASAAAKVTVSQISASAATASDLGDSINVICMGDQ